MNIHLIFQVDALLS